MDHAAYEALVQNMVRELGAAAKRLGQCEVAGGPQNRVLGASGFLHQIDATVRRPSDLLLVECKYWSVPVDAEPVLVVAARMADISAANAGITVHGSIVSSMKATAGAKTLADHFSIAIDTVVSPHEYAICLFGDKFIGVHERAQATDTFTVEIKPAD